MRYWIMKSEPTEYSIEALKRDKRQMWDGVRNYQVRNMMRDQMKVGDRAMFYHSNAGDETGVVGEMNVVSKGYPDPTQFNPKHPHYDKTASLDAPRWLAVDVQYVNTFQKPVLLKTIKADATFSELPLVKRGNRLSIIPITKKQYDRIVRLAGS